MSKRTEELYPLVHYGEGWWNNIEAVDNENYLRLSKRAAYEQAEKDTIERAIAWLKEHANDYIVDLTPTYPDAPVNIVVGGRCWDDLKVYLEDEK